MLGDPAREAQRERRQQRAVGPDAVDDRLRRRRPGSPDASAEHDPQRLPPPELDEDRLAGLEVGERGRDQVGVGPVPAAPGRVDRDLDGSPAAGRLDGDRAVRQRDLELDRVAARHGERE